MKYFLYFSSLINLDSKSINADKSFLFLSFLNIEGIKLCCVL